MILKKQISCKPGQYAVEIPWHIPSKKNSYEIFFAPKLWAAIKPIVERVKRECQIRRPYWISPSRSVKQFEQNLSTWFALYLPRFENRPLNVLVQVGQKNDVDNIAGAVLDALEKSRCIKNDRQVQSVTIERCTGIDEPVIIITPLNALKIAA